MEQLFIINKPEDFKEVIDVILTQTKERETIVITLSGDLGVGKTTFTQELGKYLGVEEIIVSPTFTIMKNYQLENENYSELVHIDAYRIESEEEAQPLHFESVFNKPKTIVCVEWPEMISSIIPQDAVSLLLKNSKREVREVSLSVVNQG